MVGWSAGWMLDSPEPGARSLKKRSTDLLDDYKTKNDLLSLLKSSLPNSNIYIINQMQNFYNNQDHVLDQLDEILNIYDAVPSVAVNMILYQRLDLPLTRFSVAPASPEPSSPSGSSRRKSNLRLVCDCQPAMTRPRPSSFYDYDHSALPISPVSPSDSVSFLHL